jgi:hypothetical protein
MKSIALITTLLCFFPFGASQAPQINMGSVELGQGASGMDFSFSELDKADADFVAKAVDKISEILSQPVLDDPELQKEQEAFIRATLARCGTPGGGQDPQSKIVQGLYHRLAGRDAYGYNVVEEGSNNGLDVPPPARATLTITHRGPGIKDRVVQKELVGR